MPKMAPMVRYWLRSSREDLRAAGTLLTGGHYRLAMFCCHLTAEKALKAVLQHQTGRLPPRLHDLRTLLARTGLVPPTGLIHAIDRLAALSIPARYPGPLSTGPLGLRRSLGGADDPPEWKGRTMVSRAVSLRSLGRRVVSCLEAHGIAVDALYLFGSQPRGEATEDSDIDFLLVSPRFAARGFWQRCRLVGRAISGLPDPVQIYPVTVSEFRNPEPGGFLESIRPQLKPVYHRPQRPEAVRDSPATKKRAASARKRIH